MLAFLILFYKIVKKGKILFNQCGKRSNCGLMIERIFEVLGKILDNDILYVFLEEWFSEDTKFKIS